MTANMLANYQVLRRSPSSATDINTITIEWAASMGPTTDTGPSYRAL
jgi:hypothetical protein